eukprot:7826744-Pyramimonas_sp.AAC.1
MVCLVAPVTNTSDVQDPQKLGAVCFKRGLVPRTYAHIGPACGHTVYCEAYPHLQLGWILKGCILKGWIQKKSSKVFFLRIQSTSSMQSSGEKSPKGQGQGCYICYAYETPLTCLRIQSTNSISSGRWFPKGRG